jgi:ubiquinone/menaquinone biosynthesis C-methylase UbiE
MSTTTLTSAELSGRAWGLRAQDWSEVEAQQRPTYEAAITLAGIRPGDSVLDVGCGSGAFLRIAADNGAAVHGLDASHDLLAIARERVPEAELAEGDLQQLPYDDDGFDAVCGFNSFFFAEDMVAALREAGRVAKPGAPVVIQVWGRPDHFDLGLMKAVLARFTPPRRPGGVDPTELWRHGTLEALARQAALVPQVAFNTSWAYEFDDEAHLARAMMSAGGFGAILGERQGEARDAILAALEPCRRPDGGYRMDNEWHFLIARAA